MPPRCDDLINEILYFRRVRLGAKSAYEPQHVLFSILLSSCNSAVTTGRISVKFDTETYRNLSENPNLVIIKEKYRALYIKT